MFFYDDDLKNESFNENYVNKNYNGENVSNLKNNFLNNLKNNDLNNIILCSVNGESIYYKDVKPLFEVELDNYYNDKGKEIKEDTEKDNNINKNNQISKRYYDIKLTDDEIKNLFMETLFSVIYERLIIQKAKEEKLEVPQKLFEEEKEKFIKSFGQDVEFEVILDDKNITMEQFDTSLKEEILLKMMLKKEVYDKIDFGEIDLYDYYQKNKDFLTPKKLYKLRQITLSSENYEKNKEEIERKLKNGEKFEEIAKIYSEDNFKLDGGLIDPLPLEAFEETIANIIKKTKVGNYTPFIEYGKEYYKYFVEDVIDVKEKSFEEIKDELAEVLKNELYNELFIEYIDSLMEKADLKFNEENLKRIFN
jgi:foldase protein PrsA